MDTGIKMLLKAERENWKKRMVKETKGTYIAIYLILIFSVFMSAMFGFKYDYSSDDKRVIISLTVFIFVVYQCVTAYVSYVRENGRSVNIFEKYMYIPVDISVLRRVKLILTARIVAPFVITGQMAAIFIRVIDPDNQGGSLIDISVFMPLIIGCLFILEKFIEYRVLSRKAALQ
jgi:hypothetical protein